MKLVQNFFIKVAAAFLLAIALYFSVQKIMSVQKEKADDAAFSVRMRAVLDEIEQTCQKNIEAKFSGMHDEELYRARAKFLQSCHACVFVAKKYPLFVTNRQDYLRAKNGMPTSKQSQWLAVDHDECLEDYSSPFNPDNLSISDDFIR